MKIILEGVDNCGKSYVCEKIKSTFPEMNFEVIHCTRDTPNNLEFFMKLLNKSGNYIFDRFCLGQRVYQTKEERESLRYMSDDEYADLQKHIAEMQKFGEVLFFHVVCKDINLIFERCKNDSRDSYYSKEYIENLISKFNSVVAEFNAKIIELNNTPDNYEVNTNKSDSPDAGLFDWNSLPPIRAVDFDGTIVKDSFPDIVESSVNLTLIKMLIEFRKGGGKLILFTCRTDDHLEKAVSFCRKHGLEFDAINDNIEELKEAGFNPRKPYYDELIDDKNSREWPPEQLYSVVNN